MSEDYYLVCVTCRKEYPSYFASASAFNPMRVNLYGPKAVSRLSLWMGEHEKHDLRILWEQDDLREDIWDAEHPELADG